jgi:hypothetical protein
MRFLYLLSVFVLCASQSQNAVRTAGTLKYSVVCRQSNYSLKDFDSGATSIIAPNRSNSIVLGKDGSFRILAGPKEIGAVKLRDLSSNIEVMWSPDSEKFSITYSDGGAEGAFHAYIYELRDGAVVERPKSLAAFDDFKARYYCQARGNNVSVEGWTPDSRSLWIVTGVFPTGDCGSNFGRLGAYLVDLSGNIIRRYGNKEAKALQSNCDKFGRAQMP